MPFRVSYHPEAKKQLEKIEPQKVRRQVLRKIDGLKKNPKPAVAKKLSGRDDEFRLRQGEHRIVYALQGSEIVILKIGHRREVYR